VRAGRVVAESRRVERDLDVVAKRQEATAPGDRVRDRGTHARRVRTGVVVGGGQRGVGLAGSSHRLGVAPRAKGCASVPNRNSRTAGPSRECAGTARSQERACRKRSC
jgi:hypothetical protein